VKRWLFNLAAAVSLSLIAVIAALWVRSYLPGQTLSGRGIAVGGFSNFPFGGPTDRQAADHFPIQFRGCGYVFIARGGGLEFYWQELRSPENRLAVGSMYAHVEQTVLGFGLVRAPRGTTISGKPWGRQGTLRLPFWFLVLLPMLLPLLWLVRSRRLRRTRWRQDHGLCRSCGYDLRGSKDRCPECGTEAKPQPTRASSSRAGEDPPRA
jgi:hypothetical protein